MSLYNLRNPAVKRLMKEAEELLHPTDEYHAQPMEDNLFEWHFTLRGPPNSDYEGGIYHGRITLPPDYPMKPPSIILLTPNGRFETNKKICLSISGYHPESWQPSWSIRTALLAIIGFMPTHGNGALGSLDYTSEERQQLAKRSQKFKCSECGPIKDFLKKKSNESAKGKTLSESESESNQNKASVVMPGNSHCENVSENSSSTQVHENNDKSTLIFRHKSSQSPTTNVEERETRPETANNFLYVMFIVAVVFILLFLCLRRLFSL